MTSTKGCGLTITSWRRMLFNRTVVACLLSAAVAVTSFAQSDSALADRIEAGDRKAALEMIGRNSPVNTSQPDGTTPLHWAVYRVDEELVKALLARGAKADIVNARDARGAYRRGEGCRTSGPPWSQRQRARAVSGPDGIDVGRGREPSRHGGVSHFQRGRRQPARQSQRLAESDDIGAPCPVSADRRPHSPAVCRSRRVPGLPRSVAQGRRGHRSAESGWDDAADDGDRQFALRGRPIPARP